MTIMNTYTNKQIDPLYIKKDDIDIIDIAHALSLLCCGNGHVKHFYSVAQHSINCVFEAKAKKLPKHVQLACLLHDASEAYIADLIRPIKKQLPNYIQIEHNILNTIFLKYNLILSDTEKEQVKYIDDALLAYDLEHLLDIPQINKPLAHIPDIQEKNFRDVEAQFLQLFYELKD